LEPQNEGTKKALQDAIAGRASSRSGAGAGGPAGGLFGADFMMKLAANPTTQALLGDPEFQGILRDVQANPMESMGKYLGHPKFKQAMQVGHTIYLYLSRRWSNEAGGFVRRGFGQLFWVEIVGEIVLIVFVSSLRTPEIGEYLGHPRSSRPFRWEPKLYVMIALSLQWT